MLLCWLPSRTSRRSRQLKRCCTAGDVSTRCRAICSGSSGLGRRSSRFLVNSEWRSTVIRSISWRARTQVSFARLDGAVVGAGERCQARALAGHLRGFGRGILGRGRAQLLDLGFDGIELRAERLGRLRGLVEDFFDLRAQAAELVLEAGQLLQRLLRFRQRCGHLAQAGGDLRRQRGLCRRCWLRRRRCLRGARLCATRAAPQSAARRRGSEAVWLRGAMSSWAGL